MGFSAAGLAVAAVGAAASAAGAANSAAGARKAGAATSAADMYQAQIAAYQAAIDRQNAEWASQAGEINASNSGLKTRAAIGQEKAATSAAGIDSTTGSARQVQAATEQIGMQEAQTIRSDAAKQAYGYTVKASNDEAQAQLDMMGAGNAVTAGNIQADSSLLSGASTVAGALAKYWTPPSSWGGGTGAGGGSSS